MSAFFASKLSVLLLFALAACSSNAGGPQAQDATRQSESEYDIARDLWLRRGQTREALEHALKAVDLDDENAEACHLVALLYLDFCSQSRDECRLPEAERHARRAIALKPDYREAKNTLAVVLIHAKKPAAAVDVLKPLTEDILYQTPENAWGNLGWAYLELGMLDPAIDALRRSIAAQPQFCVGNYRLGLAHERKGELGAAVTAYTRALETEAPGCNSLQEAWAGRARVTVRAGDIDSARADLGRCLKLSETTSAGKECRSMLAKLK
ncbi:MAG TPA: tetratricopeptide repeat protein [Polyangiaceae bacterium]